ncbi:PREDICTED: uncharacterized protein LOC109158777 [Ipomoea nil]|uniref:uncharacterized protein LOC109158777 n=1 Tax=Ipomoea nil TaxID=35883 RepID=UPI000901D03C|nr:PREDICTED: uncharacterized protein LOC109158777 [Ipomoea nil]
MVKRDHAERLRVRIGFEGLFYVDSVRNGGGLALLWRRNNTATLLGYSKNHVDIEHEKRGTNPHPDNFLRGFSEAVDDCGLRQLPMRGYQFTWEKYSGTDQWLEERLDKVLATMEWCDVHGGAGVENIITSNSDHSALFLDMNARKRGGGRIPRRFRFEMAWLLDEGCREVVETAWQGGRTEGLLNCQQRCGDRLMRWGGDHFHKFGEHIRRLRREQGRIRGRRDPASLAQFQLLNNQISQLEAQEDVFWRQRAKQHWLRGADANTKYYHRYASARKKKNSVSKLLNENGVWVEGQDMNNVVINYFNTIFATSNPVCEDSLFDEFGPRVTTDQNEALLCPYDVAEVKTALFAMYPDKAPGPDGMNPGFYQRFWDIVGEDVSAFAVNCLNSGEIPGDLNATNIVFIPKKNDPTTVADLRPIALSNVLYRIMAKMIANRLKPMLGDLISESQSAFIPGRLITDNILVAAEVGHFLNRKQCGVAGWGALKLDMAKAYDRMEWPFLKRMLEVMGFDGRWIKLIMTCVTTVSYTVMVNGVSGGQVQPTRGLRQGDPLSPFLFIICAEGLSMLLQKEQAEAMVVKRCLERYGELSGQLVNYSKSNICYSKNTAEQMKEEVAECLGVEQARNFGKYLGLPSFIGRNKRAVFSYIEEKIRQRVFSWNKKLLSQAGKEVLLKSVAQSMPTFSMSVFLLPESVCESVQRAMNRYWWGKGPDRGIHWKAWNKLCIPKKFGGLGFKDLRNFNLAMLGKQAWRFLTNPGSLPARIYKARYFPKTSFVDATMGNNPSFCWRSIMAAHDFVVAHVRRRIGNGQETLIWGHPWLQDNPSPLVQTVMPEPLRDAVVAGLIDQQTKTWDPHILTDLFEPEDVDRILRIPVSPDYKDTWYWHNDANGCYTVKDAYRRLMGEFNHTLGEFDRWITLWKLKVPPKWKTFLWRAVCDILPTTANLIIKRVDVNPTCMLCGLTNENVMHSLVLCDYSRAVWNSSGLPIMNISSTSFPNWLMTVMDMLTGEQVRRVVGVLYFLWMARNEAVWQHAVRRPEVVWRRAAAGEASYTALHSRPEAAPAGEVQTVAAGRTTCYVDAGYDPGTGDATYGAVLLDPNGLFKAAANGKLPGCLTPLMAEALACKEALSWLKDRNENEVDILTDCLVFRNAVHAVTTPNLSYVGIVIEQCRIAINSFVFCSLSFIPRTLNLHAHTLARLAHDQDHSMYWDLIPPDSIIQFLN